MNDKSLLGPWVTRFVLQYAASERNLARNTQRSYRDTLSLLITYIANKAGNQVERLNVIDAAAERVRLFLLDLE
jgi:integrase/recombinase XerD